MKTLRYGVDDLEKVIERSDLDYGELTSYVSQIVSDVAKRGDEAVKEYTKRFDEVEVEDLLVGREELTRAYEECDLELVKALETSYENIKKYHMAQFNLVKPKWMTEIVKGVMAGEKTTPIASCGCYVPGGRYAYPSTLLMTVAPAKVAGVSRAVVVSPPNHLTDAVLAACRIAGADEVYSVGGAQAIAALAYGTESIGKVDKIVGPGNKYVTAAKMLVYGKVDVDMPAGPSEVLIIADKDANPDYVAADILAQAEHDPNAQCVLTTDSEELAEKVKDNVETQTISTDKVEIISKSIENFTIVLTKSIGDCVAFADEYAPEHLEILTKDAEKIADQVANAGAIFIGPYTPVAAGDYATGTNHVLPTSAAAKYSSQLSVRDFLKTTSLQELTQDGLQKLAPTIIKIAEEEGLIEHSKSVKARLKD